MSTYTLSQDRLTLTVNMGSPVPGLATDDGLIIAMIEQGPGVVAARYVGPNVVGVLRAHLATLVNPDSTPTFPNIEAYIFSVISQTFIDNIAQRYPPAVVTALTALATAKNNLTNVIHAILAAQGNL